MNLLDTEPLAIASTLGLALLSVAIVLCFIRLVIGPSLPDRAVALDMIAVLLVGMLALHGMLHAQPESIRVAIVLALLNFLGTIAFGIYIRRKVLDE